MDFVEATAAGAGTHLNGVGVAGVAAEEQSPLAGNGTVEQAVLIGGVVRGHSVQP
jgi:hypothetical protein